MTAPTDRYRALIAATLRVALTDRTLHVAEHPYELRADVGLVAVADELGIALDPAARAAVVAPLLGAASERRVVDGAGHARPMYRALAYRFAARIAGLPAAPFRAYAARALPGVRALAASAGPLSAADASAHLERAFDALALRSMTGAQRGASADEARAVGDVATAALARIADAQRPDGTLLARTASDNLEPLWYAELALLHALVTARTIATTDASDARVDAAVRRATRYHAAEVQPDHASSHPWAIRAFLAEPDGVQLADMMLHAAGVQQPSTMDAVSLLLLADALA